MSKRKTKRQPKKERNLVALGMLTRGGSGAHKNKADPTRGKKRRSKHKKSWEPLP